MTSKDIIEKYGVSRHTDRDFSDAKIKKINSNKTHPIWIFDAKKVSEIAAKKIERAEKTAKRYAARPNVMVGTKSQLKKVLDEKMYIKLRNAWYGMMRRCYTTDRPDYYHYRKMNIVVCDKWLNSFDDFALWSLNNGVDMDLSLDRIDNNKGYSPSNCRWTDRYAQNNNSSQNVIVRYNGEEKTIGELAQEYGIKYNTLYHRIVTSKWPIEKALNTKVRVHKK